MWRCLGRVAYESVLTLYRSLSAVGLASAVSCCIVYPGGSHWDEWKVISVYGSELSLLITICAVFVGLMLGSIILTFGIRPSRGVVWCMPANVVAFFCALLMPAI